MATAYANSDVFIIPSLQDNLLNTVLETLSCGLLTIGFKIGGITDMVVSGFNGMLCEQTSYVSMKQALKQRGSIRKEAVKRFGLSVQAKKYMTLYSSLML